MEQSTAEPPEATKAQAETMLMVVTLRSGAQIRMRVRSFKMQSSPLGGLAGLEWKAAAGSPVTIEHLDLSEVVAIHTEQQGAPGE